MEDGQQDHPVFDWHVLNQPHMLIKDEHLEVGTEGKVKLYSP
jgi:hypothetical protein